MPTGVTGTTREDPYIDNRPRRRIRLTRVLNSSRGPNAGAPPSDTINAYPFPFQGLWAPARHGHSPLWHVGNARRVGAWRTGGTGTLGGNYRRNKLQ